VVGVVGAQSLPQFVIPPCVARAQYLHAACVAHVGLAPYVVGRYGAIMSGQDGTWARGAGIPEKSTFGRYVTCFKHCLTILLRTSPHEPISYPVRTWLCGGVKITPAAAAAAPLSHPTPPLTLFSCRPLPSTVHMLRRSCFTSP
jgi:hypothetical protein